MYFDNIENAILPCGLKIDLKTDGHREMNRSFSILENARDFAKGFQSGFLLGHFHFEKQRLVESHYFAEIALHMAMTRRDLKSEPVRG
jgi:hypothetical protein